MVLEKRKKKSLSHMRKIEWPPRFWPPRILFLGGVLCGKTLLVLAGWLVWEVLIGCLGLGGSDRLEGLRHKKNAIGPWRVKSE